MRILIIEDDRDAAQYLAKGLRESGHSAEVAEDGRTGLLRAAVEPFDADRRSHAAEPRRPAWSSTCEDRPHHAGSVLSALGEVDDRVTGLRAGGDDYLTAVCVLRAAGPGRESGRRRNHRAAATVEGGRSRADFVAQGDRAGQAIDLQPREFQLLETLMRHAGQVMTRTMLLEQVWNYHFDPQTNVIDVHISRLRQKIDRGFEPPLIHTVRGAGYCVREPEAAA
jgi:two-component system OmpR family response regulator